MLGPLLESRSVLNHLNQLVPAVADRAGCDPLDVLDGAVGNMALVGVHFRKRDRIGVTIEDAIGCLLGLRSDRLITLRITLPRASISSVVPIAPTAAPITTSTAVTVSVATPTATGAIVSIPTSTLTTVWGVHIESYLALPGAALNEAAEQELKRLNISPFATNQKTSVGRKDRNLDVVALHSGPNPGIRPEESESFTHPLTRIVSRLSDLPKCLEFLLCTQPRFNQNRPGSLSEVFANEAPREFFEGVSPQLLCGALKRVT